MIWAPRHHFHYHPFHQPFLLNCPTCRRQMQNMDVFREHQKQMEEANRMRREMLSAALEAKRRATNAEQQKLQVVQRELQSLDQQLNVDVSILRDRIEDASREYLEAQ